MQQKPLRYPSTSPAPQLSRVPEPSRSPYHLETVRSIQHEAKASGEAPSRRPVWMAVASLYAIIIVMLGFLVGLRVHDWARASVANSQSLPDVAAAVQGGIEAAVLNGDQTALAGNGSAVAAAPALDPITVLLMGMDSRASAAGSSANTDSMIVLSIDPRYGNVGMISLARDLEVPIAGSTITAKVNQAYALRGTDGAKGTVGNLIGHEIDYYARIDFQAFMEIVDLIDGIEVMVPETVYDDKFPLPNDVGTEIFYLEYGLQQLDGVTALKYVRTRYDNDYGRVRRQQQVVRAVFDKVRRADMLDDLIFRLPKLMSTLRNNVDTDIPLETQIQFARYLSSASLNNMQRLVLDGRYGYERTETDENGNLTLWELIPNTEVIRRDVNNFFTDLAADPESGALAQATPDWVRVEVLNGTETGGLARQMSDLLTQQGWQVVSVNDADRSDYDHTLIINYGVPDAFVQRLSEDLALGYKPNISNLEGLDSTRPIDVRIVVGQDAVEGVQ